MNNIKCPYCQASHYIELDGGYTTCVYYPPIYKDGVNINPDRNISTRTCQCLKCYEFFKYDIQLGVVINIYPNPKR